MTDLIRYDLLVQDALRAVVRRVLVDAARDGLPGEHHFYVSFRTDRSGVKLSPRLRERYPQDMTIVLQHQFEALTIGDHAFEVGLSFSGVSERLRVPFDALTGFFDPSVQFGLKFEGAEGAAETGEAKPAAASDGAEIAALPARIGPPKIGRDGRGKDGSGKDGAAKDGEPAPKRGRAKKVTPAAEAADEQGAEVVSLDAFRKKS